MTCPSVHTTLSLFIFYSETLSALLIWILYNDISDKYKHHYDYDYDTKKLKSVNKKLIYQIQTELTCTDYLSDEDIL